MALCVRWFQVCQFALAVALLPTFISPVAAEITKIVVSSASDAGSFRGKSYREVHVTMEGTAAGGIYTVPVVVAFPSATADYNGFAILDIVNTTTVANPKYVLGGRVFPLARKYLGDEYLFGSGNVYVGVLWDKKAAEYLSLGRIAAPTDGYEILHDAARLVRTPAVVPFPADSRPSRGVDKVIAFGYSQTGSRLRGFYFGQLNTRHGDPTFDGALIGVAGGGCRLLDGKKAEPCEGPPSGGGKVIAINTEGDVEWGGFVERGETRDYRAIEVAGVSHIPAARTDFRGVGVPSQNPIDTRPVFRAALANLQRWFQGTEPPPSIYVTLREGLAGELLGDPYREAVRDADGNAVGGLRLPHLSSVLSNGKIVGAPLGTYRGMDLGFRDTNVFFLLGGRFTPFSPNRIRALYASHEAYVLAVSQAAEDLAVKRYILREDADAYVQAAGRSTIGQ